MNGAPMDLPLSVIDLLRHASRNHAGVEIVSRRVEGDVHRYTYGDAYRRVCQAARGLRRWGLQPGDRVATLAWNGYRHFELYYATAGLGAVCHTINPRLAVDQIVWICNTARDRVLCFDRTFVELVEAIRPRLTTVEKYVLLGESDEELGGGEPGYEEILRSELEEDLIWPRLDERSACGLCYTSGTTGDPKGVVYTHRSTVLHAYASALPDAMALSAEDVVMPVVPMFHVNAWGLPYSLPMVGAKIVFPGCDLTGASLHKLIEDEAVTMAAGVPTIWLGLIDHVRSTGAGFSSLRRTVIGGAAPNEAMVRAFEVYHGIEVVQGWGMTETSPVATMNRPLPSHAALAEDERLALKTKQGRELFGIELRLENGTGRSLPRDGEARGALLVRGGWVVDRYDGGLAGARPDGWFDTGDIATIDHDGFATIVDRAKDVIKSGGEWISSIELENAAMEHPAVREAAVIGVADPKWGERPLLVCVAREGATVGREALRNFLKGKVARWWIPERIEFADELPHGPTGKVLKTVLRDRFATEKVSARDGIELRSEPA